MYEFKLPFQKSLTDAIRQEFSNKKAIQEELESLGVRFDSNQDEKDRTSDVVLVDRKFIHQVNKTLGGLEIEELGYLMKNNMKEEVAEVLFLATNSLKRLHQMFKDYNNYGKERYIRMKEISIKNDFGALLRSYGRTMDFKEKAISYSVTMSNLRNNKIWTDFYILAEVVETVLFNSIDELEDISLDFKKIEITVREIFRQQNKYIECLQIEIEDNGRGFDFSRGKEKYFNLGYSTKIHNTGLGLGIARELIEKIGGTMDIDNGCILPGAKTIIRIPIRRKDSTLPTTTLSSIK